MVRRTTVEIDEDLLAQAKRALGLSTTRATIEEALRRAAAEAESAVGARAERQRRYFEAVSAHLDRDVLTSDEMWR